MAGSKTIFTLDGSLCCDSNMEQLTNNIASMDGVEQARGSFASNRVTVSYRSDSVAESDITEEISNAGISVEDTATFDVSGV